MRPSSRGSRGVAIRTVGLPWLIWLVIMIVSLAVLAVVTVPAWAALSAGTNGEHRSSPSTVPVRSSPSPMVSASARTPEPAAPVSPAPAAPAPVTTPTSSARALSPAARDALNGLERLQSVSGDASARYDRASFGQAWYDEDRNGCDTRNDILRRDLTEAVLKAGTNGCKVLSGSLLDPYTQERLDFLSGTETSVLVQIDHLVPLAWAWRHGAEFWTTERRTSFANDPANLRATSGPVNQSKSDSGPGEWMPPAEPAHCAYAQDYVRVLVSWQLGIEERDRRALQDTLRQC